MPPSHSLTSIWNGSNWEISTLLPLQPTDRGFLHGLGLFETILASHSHVHFLPWHLVRLSRSCSQLRWTTPIQALTNLESEFKRLIQSFDSIKPSNHSPASTNSQFRIRLTITGGSGRLNDLTPGPDANVSITVSHLDPPPESLAVLVSPWTRNTNCPLVGLKTTSYAANLVALDHARSHGFDETLFLNQHGHLCEAATANVFLLLDGHWHTPPLSSGCLPGITRRWFLEIEATETQLTPADLQRAEAILLTSATRGPLPVHQLGERLLPLHPATTTLRQRWKSAAGIPL